MNALLHSLFVNLSVLITFSFVLSLTYRRWPPPPGLRLPALRLGLTVLTTMALYLMASAEPSGTRIDLGLVPIAIMTLRYGGWLGVLCGLPAALLPLAGHASDALISVLNLLAVAGLAHSLRWTLNMEDAQGSLRRYGWAGSLVFLPNELPLWLLGDSETLLRVYLPALAFNVLGFWAVAVMITSRVALLQSTDQFRLQALQDALCGLPNRRQFEQDLPLTAPGDALLLIDLDHFKRVNDEFGHPVGDEVLAAVGRVLADTLRSRDRAYRYGGEEFAVILRRVPAEQLPQVAQRLREAVGGLRFAAPLDGITVSIGGASFGPWSSTRTLWQADEALYRVKQSGRNGVRIAAPSAALPDSGPLQALLEQPPTVR
ncbi:GGDEF domain-containing protein [Deinococcus multiflagellatus]|uniref:GGDEF domain-containing protein n=1 Tax=Deinococcus multiflagellatus TaxID=1656887 RepID=UPI001CCAE3DB|nr:GGDEF domain-containing protein [Deinococcus multiflagellatus]MBZ9713511.1 GGDEF domain-containing protein [Deinococcus multiflagellatus]